jgi:hypothetical protein
VYQCSDSLDEAFGAAQNAAPFKWRSPATARYRIPLPIALRRDRHTTDTLATASNLWTAFAAYDHNLLIRIGSSALSLRYADTRGSNVLKIVEYIISYRTKQIPPSADEVANVRDYRRMDYLTSDIR